MNRRASLPGAEELFRPTGQVTPLRPSTSISGDARPSASGRRGHDTKITVYLTQQELLDLEQARLRLRAEFGIAVDRGRIVREAVAELLTDLEEHGPDSAVVRALS